MSSSTMQRDTKPEGLDLCSGQLQRKESYRDRTPSISGSAGLPPTQLVPEPAYIAPSAATQIVNSEYVSRSPNWLDDEISDASGGLMVSSASLALVNAFLDQMLFSFLKGARSTSIVALKPAITDVLKPRLAKDAIQGADEELKGYLTGGEDEELSDFHTNQEFKGERNLQRIFRTTRLRCMVYTRLGDMEEEDEEMYLEEEQAQDQGEERRRLSRDLGNVSPAAAIFLTSIIEFIGEQALMIAGEAAFNRVGTKKPNSDEQTPVVEEGDVEKLAFNTTLGRLWRSWRSRSRPTSLLSPRPSMRDLQGRKPSISTSEFASRTTSVSEGDESTFVNKSGRPGLSVAEILHDDRDPALIPLPPPRGLPDEPDFSLFAESHEVDNDRHRRVRSMIEYAEPREPPFETVLEEVETADDLEEHVPRPRHQRSSSLPVKASPYVSPLSDTFATPMEGPDPFTDDEEERVDAEKTLPRLTDDSQTVTSLQNDTSAVSTMYDGIITGKHDPAEASKPSTREVSMVSEYSSNQDVEPYDHDMTPQALNFKKTALPNERGAVADRVSQASTVSSQYSFGPGDPVDTTGIFGSKKKVADKRMVDGSSSSRVNSLDQSSSNIGNAKTEGAFQKATSTIALQGDRLRPYDESGKAAKRDIPVLYEDPSNQNVLYNSKTATHNPQQEPTAPTVSRTHVQGVPPLTPLRELRDAAQDTSDEASSVADSYGASRGEDFAPPQYPRGGEGEKSETYTSVNATQIQPTAAATRYVEQHKQSPITPNTGAERAAVQRVSPSPAGGRDTVSPYGRSSTSSNREGRSVAGSSGSSKVNKIVGRESDDQVRQSSRISSDTNEKLPIRYSKTPRTGNKELDFESLIKSDETIQYTLTPQNMRDMEDPESPRWSDDARPSINSHIPSRSISQRSVNVSAGSANQLKGMNGLRANPAISAATVTDFASPVMNRTQSQGPIPKSPGGKAGVRPRDASLKDGSMQDFADFIRSTGPETDPKNMYRKVVAADQHSRNASASSQQASKQPLTGAKQSSKKIAKQAPAVAPRVTEGTPQRSASKLKARDPTLSSSNTTADLAEFLRSGPPTGFMDDGAHFARSGPVPQASNGVANGRAIGSGTSLASTQDSFAPSKMTQSSTNSRTGLLDSTNRSVTKTSAQRQMQDMGGPIRKQRRVRDPFAIDSDDEDDSIGGPPEEESLSDFLRNYTPPPEPNNSRDVSISLSNSPPSADPKRKASGTTMRERLARNIAVIPDYRPLPAKNTPQKKTSSTSRSPPLSNEKRQPNQRSASGPFPPQRSVPSNSINSTNGTVPQLPPLNNSSSSSPHPSSTNGGPKPDAYRPTGYPSQAQPPRPSASNRPKPQARNEASARNSSGGLNDLAEFLRDTEPPAPSRPIMSGGGMGLEPKERDGGFGRMFGRRRKV